jgi:hypothetical protein
MELWLIALIALALIPTVRVFMAAGCRRAPEPPPPPGTHPLTVVVSATGANPSTRCPDDPDAVVSITDGVVRIHPPSGHPTLESAVPRGGLIPGREFPVTAEMFAGTESPYRWTGNCTVSYECTAGPSELVGRGTVTGVGEWHWDANRDATFAFRLQVKELESDVREPGETEPRPGEPYICHYEWELIPLSI